MTSTTSRLHQPQKLRAAELPSPLPLPGGAEGTPIQVQWLCERTTELW